MKLLTLDQHVFEKAKYTFDYVEKDLQHHLKKFLQKNVKAEDIPSKVLNFYKYSVNYLSKKYRGFDPMKDDQEGPADEDYMKILNRVATKLSI